MGLPSFAVKYCLSSMEEASAEEATYFSFYEKFENKLKQIA